jgi:hypothetical protein
MKTIEELANTLTIGKDNETEAYETAIQMAELMQRWIPVGEELPQPLKRVNCKVMFGTSGKPWTAIAQYVPYMTVPEDEFMDEEYSGDGDYNEEEDRYYTPEGWYESNLYSDINYKISDEVISWRPIELK